jgi:hypothetical protein
MYKKNNTKALTNKKFESKEPNRDGLLRRIH